MKTPRPDEIAIEGRWIFAKEKMIADESAIRIDHLTSSYLELVDSIDGWSMLYRDPEDGRLWEKSYPHGDMHGGGPPNLTVISADEARKRYSNIK